MPKYLSGRSKVTRQSELSSDRYRYLSIENAEPNLGDPLVGPSSVGAKPTPPGQQFIMVSVEGSIPGERYWIPNQGGIIPGSISVFDDNVLVGALSSITQLNFVGAAITASVSIASSNLATIRVFSPGNNQEIIFNTANEFSTSTKLKFDPSNGLLTAGDRIIVGAGGTVITTTGVGSVGIGTTNPTQELHVQGDLRLTGTIYDSINQPGTNTQLLVKNNFGGLNWIDQGTIRAGAGGTYQNIQFHNSVGLVDGASNFVFDEINNRIGIGSTQPKVLLDVLGISSFKGGTTIDSLNVTGVTTTRNLTVTGVSTVGFVTGTSAFFTGIVTATKFVGEVNVSNLYVTGISTFLQKVNINSDLGVTGITTTQNLQVYQSTTLNRLNATGVSTFTTIDINGGEIDVTRIGTQNLNVSGVGTFNSQVNINNLNVTGVGTFDNIKIYDNNIETTVGNLIIDSQAGITQINDAVYISDATQSTSKDTGSIITEGGVGIELDLYVGGQVNLATSGGITTTGGDLYVRGDLYVSDDIFYDELFARNGYFTGITSTKDLNVTGIATIATLGVTGLTTTRNLIVSGISTFNGLLDANAGATIDNIQIGISADNEIDTSIGNLILDSFGGTVEITDQLIVSGVSTFQGNVILGNDPNADTVTFTSRVNSNVLPSTNGTLDLGGTSNRWSNIYATTFNGSFVGNADTASQVSTGTTTGTITYYPTFVDSNNTTRGNEFLYTDAGISYNLSTELLSLTNITVSGVSTFQGNVTIGNANTNTVSFGATVNSNIIPSGTTRDLGSVANKWNNVYVNNIFGNVTGAASSLSVTSDSANLDRRIVLSSVTSGISTVLADGNLLYNPSTNLLTVPNIRPTAIQDTSGGTGTNNYVLTANGTGGWTWEVASTSSGSAAIGGITIQDEGSAVGNQLGITTVNFVGDDITATASGAVATITLTTTAAAAAGAAAGASAAQPFATSAANSATNAANSASAAGTSAGQAGTSATNASNSATAAGTSATNASNSATAAGTSATNAANSATAAANSATAAGTSATNASNSATAAGTSATNASNSATAAGTSATNAANSATNAANSATAAAVSAFPAGTLMLFQQTTAPTGWTKQTTHNDKALRVVSGTASSGGNTSFTSVFTSRTPAGTVDNHTLTTAQIPSHTHTYTQTSLTPTFEGTGFFLNYADNATPYVPSSFSTNTDGGNVSGGAHSHGFTGTSMNFAVQYVDLIIASKN